jgi:diguanylate cyclase (GGDEF)-like protein
MLHLAPSSPQDRPLSLAEARYISLVDKLLVEVKWLVRYGAAASFAGVLAAAATQNTVLWIYAGLIFLTTCFRLLIMRWHARGRPSASVEIAEKYETAYALGVISFMGVLSTWTLAAFWVSDDAFVRCLTFSSTISYAFGMLARSFAINKGMNVQIAIGFVPLSAAMLISGGLYPLLIFILIAPLFLSIKASAVRLKGVFAAEVEARSEAAQLAERLDTALNNMSHGLCMFDVSGRLVFANDQIPSLFRLQKESVKVGTEIRGFLAKLVEGGIVEDSKLPPLTHALLDPASEITDYVVPLETRDGRSIEVTVHRMSAKGAVFVFQDITARRNAELAIDRMARFDTVTDLPNRRHFEGQLKEALSLLQTDEQVTVLFIDLDDFKQVNDSLGHVSGDALLVETAKRLRKIVGDRGLVARWGGDEFIILLRSSALDNQAAELATLLLKEIEQPVFVGEAEIIVGASIGSASAPEDGTTHEAILSNADMALYAAKATGRRCWRPFERSMDTKVHIRRLFELDLRGAVANDTIDVFFQPILNVATSKVVSFEALARWNHPVRGRISPAEFIPVVETIGLMNDMGSNILKRACLACASWPEDIRVSVNLSPSQFKTGRILQTVEDALREAQISPDRLDLEITESVLLDDDGATRELLQTLRARGVRVSLDDFGTGYSSLSYLLSFPLDRIKIDRSFTVGLGIHERSSIVIESISSMSQRLGMSVLIEGVETDKQLRLIEEMGTISEVQGFFFSPALPKHEVGKLLSHSWQRSAA